jgi:hypothetical protein
MNLCFPLFFLPIASHCDFEKNKLHIEVYFLKVFYFRYRDSMATLRSLKIKTSRCKQSVEELHTYEQEVEREAATVAYLRDEGDDPHWLKQEVCLNIVFFKGSC